MACANLILRERTMQQRGVIGNRRLAGTAYRSAEFSVPHPSPCPAILGNPQETAHASWPVLPDPGAKAVDRDERIRAHLRSAGADPLCRAAGLRERVVLRASLPPGLVAQQRAGPDFG